MRQLAARLEALDPDVGKALKALAYFDRLIEGRVGIEGFVRGAAVLGGHTAGLVDPDRAVQIRVNPDGLRLTATVIPDERWLTRTLDASWSARVWLETTAAPGAVEEMVIDRFAQGARLVLERTRGRPHTGDEATVEVLLDAAAPRELRMRSARALGFTDQDRLRAFAVLDSSGLKTGGQGLLVVKPRVRRSGAERFEVPGRMGIGTAGSILDLPASYRSAVAALRLTTSGTRDDPGPRHLCADHVGALVTLADTEAVRSTSFVDVERLKKAAEDNDEFLATLDAFVTHISLRAAADHLHVHHSTMQSRMQQAEKLLGWSINSTEGRFRLQMALALRLLQRKEF
jgi:hypothetical protein